MKELERWKRGHGIWRHRCIHKGTIELSRAHMGLYRVDDEGNHRESYEPDAEWELDEPGGCPFCGEFPPDLESLVTELRSR